MQMPHDDTASLIAFYGDPRKPGFQSNLVVVTPPWQMTYEGRPIKGVRIHRKLAASLIAVFADIYSHFGKNVPECVVDFSGSYNFRPVRGSGRLSCHAFGAAVDLDAAHNPMNTSHNPGTMHPAVISAFKKQGWYWGGDFRSRQDPMHFQAAHEGMGVERVVATDEDFGAPNVPYVDVAPPVQPIAPEGRETRPEPPVAPKDVPQWLRDKAERKDVIVEKPSLWTMFKSKQGITAVGLGTAGVSEGLQQVNDVASQVNMAKWQAQQLGVTDILLQALHQPMFWVAVLTIAGAMFVWFEHRKYKHLVAELKAKQ